MAQDGLARALYPAHTTLDGDTVFAVATGRRPLADAVNELAELGAVAANTLARAVARGYSRRGPARGPPSWQDRHGK
jgi:L-aminopeptidase/D-esterase-like protein